MLESEEELKSFLLRVKEESEEASLKFNIHKTKIMTSSPITSGQIEGEKVEAVTNFIFLGSKITWMVTAAVKLKDNSWRENHDKPRQNIKKQRYHLLTKVCIVKTMFLSGSHVQMWELDCKEDGVLKDWHFWIVVLEKILKKSLGQQGDQTNCS